MSLLKDIVNRKLTKHNVRFKKKQEKRSEPQIRAPTTVFFVTFGK